MGFMQTLRRRLFGGSPLYDAAGAGRRSRSWVVGKVGAVTALAWSQDNLRAKSRDAVRKNTWAAAGIEAFVANAIGTGIKPQSMVQDAALREAIHSLWWDWCEEADAAGLTDFYGLQALATRSMLEGGECFIRMRSRRPQDMSTVPMQVQVLESEHVPITYNAMADNGNPIRCGIEFDAIGRRVAYWMYPVHPDDPLAAPMSGTGTSLVDLVRVPAAEVLHLFRPLRPGQIRGEPWLARALVKLHELDQYDDAELVRKKTAAMFAGFIRRDSPEDRLLGETSDTGGGLVAGMEPGTIQILEPGEDISFTQPSDVGGSYGEFMRQQFRAVAAAMGVTYEMLTGDLTQVNYSSIRAGLLEFRRRCEAIQDHVIVHQLCRPVWAAWMDAAVLAGLLDMPGYTRRKRDYRAAKWIAQGWQWVDPLKEINAQKAAIRAGLLSRAQAVSASGYDVEDMDAEIAADNQRADGYGLVFDSDPRHDQPAQTQDNTKP